MHPRSFRTALIACLITICSLSFLCGPGYAAMKRDHLTPMEVEQVRAAQILDKRIEVFIKVCERRLLLLTDPQAAMNKQVQKDVEKWGELPKGTRAELFTDLARILDEAITNIDDVAARDMNNRLLGKALRKLSAASTRFISQLTPMRATAKDETEREALEAALENAEAIIVAANKLPPEVKEKEKDKDKGKAEKNKS